MRHAAFVALSLFFVASVGCGKPAASGGPAAMNGADTVVAETLAKLPSPDREVASQQKLCPVSDEPLGSMGVPVKLDVEGKPVFICCAHCEEEVRKDPAKYLAKAEGKAPVESESTHPVEPAPAAETTPAAPKE